ncbi:MAG: type II toxin-antitoxin system VapC family toxin [Candidatus Omnitrophica bacterium]|nr:type II toxin-antitoxin system VapC family toxin [Candidatus Omnitrophota bacterium]
MTSIYIETSIPSYLAAQTSSDLVIAGHQAITRKWWPMASKNFDCFVSEAVISEVSRGDPDASKRRMECIQNIEILAYSEEIESLIRTYSESLGLTGAAIADLPHFAYAVGYGMDYMATWNCRHIANGNVIRRLMEVNRQIGRDTPVIVTPEELPVIDVGGSV